jgi:hypothetical protein
MGLNTRICLRGDRACVIYEELRYVHQVTCCDVLWLANRIAYLVLRISSHVTSELASLSLLDPDFRNDITQREMNMMISKSSQ